MKRGKRNARLPLTVGEEEALTRAFEALRREIDASSPGLPVTPLELRTSTGRLVGLAAAAALCLAASSLVMVAAVRLVETFFEIIPFLV